VEIYLLVLSFNILPSVRHLAVNLRTFFRTIRKVGRVWGFRSIHSKIGCGFYRYQIGAIEIGRQGNTLVSFKDPEIRKRLLECWRRQEI